MTGEEALTQLSEIQPAEFRKLAEEEFGQELADFDWKDVANGQRLVDGAPAEVVLGLQDEYDLIAMGSHGRTGLSAAVLGNVAYSILKQSRVPVLAIRHPERSWLLA